MKRTISILLALLTITPLTIGISGTLPPKATDRIEQTLQITSDELSRVAEKIYRNETGGKRENLMVWNIGENFPSLGIGHFIWYKAGEEAHFEESFPGLVNFFVANDVELPYILKVHKSAPWPDRESFLRDRHNISGEALLTFLEETKELQILYIYQRLEGALAKMEQQAKDPIALRTKFYRIAAAENGLYALIDYVNFKGEGVNPNERYQNQGWGLLQVLEAMPPNTGELDDSSVMAAFSNAADQILTQRVSNADPSRNEERWLTGWRNRVASYRIP